MILQNKAIRLRKNTFYKSKKQSDESTLVILTPIRTYMHISHESEQVFSHINKETVTK